MKTLINFAIRYLKAPFVSKIYFDNEINKRNEEIKELQHDVYSLLKHYNEQQGLFVRIKYQLKEDVDRALFSGSYKPSNELEGFQGLCFKVK